MCSWLIVLSCENVSAFTSTITSCHKAPDTRFCTPVFAQRLRRTEIARQLLNRRSGSRRVRARWQTYIQESSSRKKSCS